LLPGGANAYPAYGLSCCCRVALTLTPPTVRAGLARPANPFPAYGPTRCSLHPVTLTRHTVRQAVDARR
ncbi:hypothetical protein, partial [Enterobacter hormaechei]